MLGTVGIRLIQAADQVGFGILVLSLDDRILYANPAFERLIGLPRQQLIGHSLHRISATRDAPVSALDRLVELLSDHQVDRRLPMSTEIEVEGPAAKVYEVSVWPVSGPRGTPAGRVIALRDITKRRKAEEDIRRHVELEKLVADLAGRFVALAPEEIDSGIRKALKTIGEFVGADYGDVFLISEDGRRIVNTHGWCAEGIESHADEIKEISIHAFPWWMGRIRRLETINLSRLSDLPSEAEAERQALSAYGIKLMIAIPMARRGSAVGFLCLGMVRSERVWGEEDAILLRMVAGIFVDALVRGRAEQRVRRGAECAQTLVRTAARLNSILDLNEVLATVCEEAARSLHVQGASVSLYDKDKQALVHGASFGLVSGDEQGQVVLPSALQSLLAQGIVYVSPILPSPPSVQAFDAQGRTIPLSWMVVASMRHRGELVGSLSVFLSERKQQLVDEELALLRGLAEQAAQAIVNAQMYERLSRMVTIDPMTDLINHRCLLDRLEEEMARACRSGHPLAVMMLDIDDFKLINDVYGHLVGDQVLREVARILRENLRSTDVLGRYGGTSSSPSCRRRIGRGRWLLPSESYRP